MKDKNVAGILALFFGWIGIHRFYLGQVGLGILYALLFWSGISAVLGLIDAIVFFSMDKDTFDIKYNRQYYRAERRRDREEERRHHRRDYRERREQWERREADRREHRRPDNRRHHRPAPKSQPNRPNPYKSSGIKKYKDYDYDGAIADFKKALEISPKDIAVHFNLACAYSLNENTEKALYHLDKAVAFGFDDFQRIREHDALAFLRIQPEFEEFEKNNFRLVQQLDAPEEDLLDSSTGDNLLDQLKKLGELREKGLLTEEEFVAQKEKLLNQ
jgi:TM2 domain-containing membrane protein YozV